MRILLLTPQRPYPPHQGTSLRNFNIIRGLAERHAVHLLTFADGPGPARDPLAELCRRVTAVPAPAGRASGRRLAQLLVSGAPDLARRLEDDAFAARLRTLLRDRRDAPFDVVQIEGLEMAPYLGLARKLSPGSRLIYDAHNAEGALQARAFVTDRRRLTRWPAAAYSWLQARRLRAYESAVCRAADGVAVVSEVDAARLRALVPERELTLAVVPNTIDVAAYARARATANTRFDVLFSGKMDYRPNVDAVRWFAAAVWPGLRAVRPELRWAIVGQRPSPAVVALGRRPGITVTGAVPAVEPFLAGAGVVVLPFRIGGGSRLKLIEALAAGRPVVSTTVGAEGFPVRDGRELLLADTASSLASTVARVLDDATLAARLGAAGQAWAASYDWRVVAPAFDALYEAATPRRPGSGDGD